MGQLVSADIPNLVSGVSQQPWNVRLPTQAEEQINCFSSVSEFLKRRPATRHIARLRTAPFASGKCAVHHIHRDANERYVALFTNDTIEVYDLQGNKKTVYMDDTAKAYLANCTPETDLRFLTINDYTFVLNRQKTIKANTAKSPKRNPEALVFIKQASYNTTYKLTVAGTNKSYTTADGIAPAGEPADPLSSLDIANSLASGLTSYNAKVFNNVIWLSNASNFTVSVNDTRANTHISVIRQKVQRFSDLPVNAPNGYMIEITGDASSSFDNYFCKFETLDGSSMGAGVWKETVAPNIPVGLDASTMPHALIRREDGAFDFTSLEWTDRVCGDAKSAAHPSFVDRTISDIFFYRNRLCFLSAENVIMSEAGEFYNFYPTTVTTMVDSDRIDVAASHIRSSALENATVFSGGLLLFSKQCQFTLEHDNTLANSTVSVKPVTEFEASTEAIPVSSGKTVFFAANHGGYGGVREYLTLPDNSEQNDATDLSSHAPRYIRGEVRKLICSVNEDILLVLSKGDRTSIYVYKYFWNGNEKIQSAWCRFQMAGEVLTVFFIDTKCWLVMQYADGICLEYMDFTPGYKDTAFEYCLDRKITETSLTIGSYDKEANTTQVTFPWQITAMPVIVQRENGEHDFQLVACSTDKRSFTFRGDLTGRKLFAGIPYYSGYTFSTFAIRENQKGNAVTTGRLQLRKMTLNCTNTGFLKIRVAPQFRDASIYPFSGKQLGHGTNILGQIPLYTGTITCPILSLNTQVQITVESESFLPFAIVNASWEGFYNTRSRSA